MRKTKIINLYAGPGTGKSTTAARVFSELKLRGVNCEYVQEYAKDKAWELGSRHIGTPKVFEAQEYIFAKQHFRFRRCAEDVDIIITDCPLFLGLIYTPTDFPLPSLRPMIREAYDLYDNYNVFLQRRKPYNPKGRFQTEDKAKQLDVEILELLKAQAVPFEQVKANRKAADTIVELVSKIWTIPDPLLEEDEDDHHTASHLR